MFRKVLIANRGEIARRVIATCRRLGIETVAVHSDADADAPHVRDADEAIRLGPAPAAESYLDVERLMDAARRSGAAAIHPGYGFLSENAGFAAACEAAGIVFVGPRPETIRLMGDKAAAKRRLEAAGVPVVPGVHDDGLVGDELAAAADRVGYPILVKAVAGGGGKGMRAVHAAADLVEAVAAARREAIAAFDDDRVLLERLVHRPRHVEVQVLGDTHGQVIHVLERECSVQRRHQKVVEETPSPAVDPDLRRRMGAAAVEAAAAVDYVGAGTVEFLLADSGEFFFLEMNTRIQVEHPVTEMVTGLDLVELQLRIASGEPLPLTQDEVVGQGHAIEVRLYAEDPATGFLPQTGRVVAFDVPAAKDIRVDSGVETGTEVSRFYDPMLAKLVVHAVDRAAALDRMRWVLEHTAVLGVTTNVEFLTAIVDHPVFREGEATTTFIEEHLPDWAPVATPPGLLLAAAAALQRSGEERVDAADPYGPWHRLGPWRAGQVGGWHLMLRDGHTTHHVTVTGRGGRYQLTSDGTTVTARVGAREGDRHHIELDGYEQPARVVVADDVVWAQVGGISRRLTVIPATRHADPGLAATGQAFTSPMPGAVIAVKVEEGVHVAAGTTLVVIEAMKMEHPVKAPVAGTVGPVHVTVGDAVDAGAPLLGFSADGEPDDEVVT